MVGDENTGACRGGFEVMDRQTAGQAGATASRTNFPEQAGSATSERIARVQVKNLRFEYPPGNELRSAQEICNARVTSLVLVTAGNGAVGVGSVDSHPLLVEQIVERDLGPMIIGEPVRDIASVWQRMYELSRWYGRKGAVMSAIGGIDTALWDLRGKLEGISVRELIGASRSDVEAYASGLLWKDDLDELRAETRRHLDNGFLRMKMRLGRGRAYDVAALDAVVGELGPASLIVDGSHRYDVMTAVWLAGLLTDRGVSFFEEPFKPEDINSYVTLSRIAKLPLAAGENEFGVQGFSELLRAGAVGVVQPDATRCGGITEALRIGRLAESFGALFVPHTWSDAIGIIVNATVVAAVPTGLAVEVDTSGNALVDHLVRQPIRVDDGRSSLPDGPGLGFELNDELVDELALPSGTLPHGHYSDVVVGREYVFEPPPYEH